MINLDDSMTADELIKWWGKYRFATKSQRLEIFGRIGRGTVKAMRDCANYAANKSTAIHCRGRGDIQSALMYENIANRIYQSLPEYAKW